MHPGSSSCQVLQNEHRLRVNISLIKFTRDVTVGGVLKYEYFRISQEGFKTSN